MSLIHWFPLNGDVKDYGTENVSMQLVNGSPTLTSAGKIGKCYTNASYNSGAYVSTTKITLGQNQSMFAWFKFSSLQSESALGGAIVGTHRYPNNCGMGITVRYVSSTTGYISVNTGNGSSRTYNTYYGSTLLQANTWYHVGFTYDGVNIKLYVNGNLDGTFIYTGMSVPEDYLMIGAWSLEGATTSPQVHVNYKLNGSINDVRIYNHTLSLKEVKEISKGLILHYNFEDPYVEGTTNLVPNSNDFDSWEPYTYGYTAIQDCELGGKKVVITNKGSWCGILKSGIQIPSTGTYTLSVWCKPISRSSTSVNQTLYFSGGGYSDIATSVSWSTPGQWTRVSRTITFTNTNPMTLYLIAYGGIQGTDKVTCEYTMPQLEKLDHATPYVNGTRPTSPIYDNSGYGYNGTINGNLQISTNTGIGKYSAIFNGIDTGVQTPDLSSLIHDGNFTITQWFLHTDAYGSKTWETLYGGPSGFEIEGKYSSTTTPQFVAYNWGGSGSEDQRFTYTINEWHQYAMVRTTTGTTWYMDGVQIFTGSAGTIPSGDYFIGAWKTAVQQNFKGRIADFKIYATALSANDIKAEYKRKASIDKNGNLYTGSFVEDNSTEELLFGNQIGSNANFTFSGTGTLTNTEDGSLKLTDNIWVRTPKFKVVQGETLYYDITYSNDTAGNLIYFGFERFDDNGVSGENELCFYLTSEAVVKNHYRIKGTLTVSGNSSAGNPITNWRVRILNKWTGSSATGSFIIHHMSLRRSSEIKSQKVLKTGIFKTNDLREDKIYEKVSFYKNGFTGAKEFKEI